MNCMMIVCVMKMDVVVGRVFFSIIVDGNVYNRWKHSSRNVLFMCIHGNMLMDGEREWMVIFVGRIVLIIAYGNICNHWITFFPWCGVLVHTREYVCGWKWRCFVVRWMVWVILISTCLDEIIYRVTWGCWLRWCDSGFYHLSVLWIGPNQLRHPTDVLLIQSLWFLWWGCGSIWDNGEQL